MSIAVYLGRKATKQTNLQTVQTLIKCSIIWVFTVCQSIHLGVSSKQRVNNDRLSSTLFKAKDKEDRYTRRLQRRAELEAKKKEREEEKAKQKKEKEKKLASEKPTEDEEQAADKVAELDGRWT